VFVWVCVRVYATVRQKTLQIHWRDVTWT